MSLKNFQRQLQSFNAIRLIGPLCPQGFVPSLELPIIYIDGGLQFKASAPHLSFSIGDGDSFVAEPPDLLLDRDKNFSDLEYTLSQLPSHLNEIHMHGFLGGRRDHEWINLGVIHSFIGQRQTRLRVDLDSGQVQAVNGGTWQFLLTGLFSVFCFEDTHLRLAGDLKYPYVEAAVFPKLSSYGLSNEGFGTVELSCDRPVFIAKAV